MPKPLRFSALCFLMIYCAKILNFTFFSYAYPLIREFSPLVHNLIQLGFGLCIERA